MSLVSLLVVSLLSYNFLKINLRHVNIWTFIGIAMKRSTLLDVKTFPLKFYINMHAPIRKLMLYIIFFVLK